MGNSQSPQVDCQNYLDGYPGLEEPPLEQQRNNLDFYLGLRESVPDGAKVDVVLETYYGNYNLLEQHHGYIQWIFPIREHGMNREAFPLTAQEAIKIRESPEAMARILKAYYMMLDFYGINLINEEVKSMREI
mmetsp:Transcript_10410/g.13629  ORF Transcript_10410/g.13629 Transcript_10410/m.13629 type:complete len:133 (-) Transcript_10410:38-436(-)